MRIIENYWKHIAKKLKKAHPEQKSPADWTKSEAQSFLKQLQSKTDKSISPTTFRRIFKEGHLGKLETRDIFAQHFDYPTHGDYINKEIKKRATNWYWLLVLPIALGIGAITKNWTSNISQNTPKEAQILAVVDKAITDQFAAFKAIPNYQSNLESLKDIYLTSGSAYQEIASILIRQSNLNWSLNNPSNASTAQLINVGIDSIRKNQAFVTTTEHWRLDWFNQAAQREAYKYEVTNEQKYILVREAPSQPWKILQNEYSGNKFRYIPNYIPCDNITSKLTDLQTIKINVRKAVENDGLELALSILDCHYRNNNTQIFPDALSLLLAEKTKLLRAVNTDEIDKTAFEIKKGELFKKILDFCKKL